MPQENGGDPPTSGMENLHLDPVTGDRVSKSELKKRTKQREQEEKKKQKKAAQAPPRPEKKTSAKYEEAELNPNQVFEMRSLRVQRLRETRSPNPYPQYFAVTHDVDDFNEEFGSMKKGEHKKDMEVRVIGRIRDKRESSKKLIFYDLQQMESNVQIMCQAQESTGSVPFEDQHEYLGLGDYIGIIGYPGRTAPKGKPGQPEPEGELSVFAREVVLLTPSLHLVPPPRFARVDGKLQEVVTVKDPETRFRNRELDLMTNKKSREALILRHKMTRYLRTYFDDRKFIEVETPMMNQIAGGATAKPFKTHINEYKQDLYMRVAPELYLKRLCVGGLERVYEIGKNFRNEGADLTHNPEFTSLEFYRVGWDMWKVMECTEHMVSGLVSHVMGSYETTFNSQEGETYKINWTAPWKRIDMIPALEEATGKKFPPGQELHTQETNAFLQSVLKECAVECSPPQTNARMIDKLVGRFIEEKCINPTFIIGHPQMMSPLAKAHRDKPGLCERFEAFVCKSEICNAYTELNDPFDQRARFEEQASQKAQGDDEAQLIDPDFIKALEYGLPPTGGFGMGIDRLAMFLTNNYSIREVLGFPYMRAEQQSGKPKATAAEIAGVEPKPTNHTVRKP